MMCLTKKRRSQVEIVGLLIIVLMISFILIFALRSYLKKPDDTLLVFKKENLASSLLSSILRTTTDCNNNEQDMKDLLINCAKWRESPSIRTICDNGQDSCKFFSTKAEMMLNETLNEWKMSYELIIIPPTGDFLSKDTWLIHIEGGNSTGIYTGNTATQPLPMGSSDRLEMMFCIGGCGFD
ncbi:hypothetical protein JXB31_01300 [Candidatus Woesearchaeota archaeon]|nr:hypothetical protein [Candidatus Woesearchaeota archaeon]